MKTSSFRVMSGVVLASIALSLAASTPTPAQVPSASLAVTAKKSPQQIFPGLIGRVYNTDKKVLTNVLAVVQSGSEFKKQFKPKAEDELRGKFATMNLFCLAKGLIVLDRDTEIAFTIEANDLLVDQKDLGQGKFVKILKKGKHTVELSNEHGRGQGEFLAVDANTGKSVLCYTGEMLNTEIARRLKIEGKFYETIFLNDLPSATTSAK